jgi:peptidoglycan/LPS O-acetylase OafA/YrhL/CubicO group peptidase (beta-lactamase class C family)
LRTSSALRSETSTSDAAQSHLPYLPGLDGLRALAVVAVLLYHAEMNVYGGYLGVESFFVLSGFLITAILLADWRAHQRIHFKTFWARRARRLLPALLLTLAGTLLLTAFLLPDRFAELTHDTLAALGYVTNWYLIAREQSYFDAVERPPLLQHLWSLAIEEQFYVVWPLIVAVALRFVRARGLLALTLLATLASAILMASLYEPGADPSRIYYGTDTRASALLLGAALALVWAPFRTAAVARRRVGLALDIAGVLALAGLLLAYWRLHEQHPLLYRGGFSLVDLCTVVSIAAATHPAARLVPWLLERQPLRWIGLRSYGIYLWHWPIFVLTRPGVDIAANSWLVQVLRFGSVCVLAALSYALVEQPIRRGALGRVWRALRQVATRRTVGATLADSGQAADDRAGMPAGALPGLAARMLDTLAGRPRAWYRRWAPVIAASTLALGVLCVAASVARAALHTSHQAQSPASTSARSAALPTSAARATAAPAATTGAPDVSTAATPVREAQADSPTTVPETTIDPALAAELQRILDATVADESIPGAVLSIELADGTTWIGASGRADRASGEPMTPEMRVRIGSLSKMFTAVVVLQLVEEGKLELDKSVATWLPDLLPDGDAITVRQLLQHTSGLYDYFEDRALVREAYAEPERVWEPRELVEYAVQFPSAFEPGAQNRWSYSSTNYVVLGMLVEQVTGNSFAAEVRRRILEPLELRETYVTPEEQVQGPQARGYSKGDDHTAIAMSFGFAAANIVTTADDLRRFGHALFAGQLLEPETYDLMEQFVDGKGQYGMPELEYGLGLMRNQLPVGLGPNGQLRPAEQSRVIGHIGGLGGFRAALWYAPESQTLVALSVNQTSTDPNRLATQVLDALLKQQGL